MTICNISIVEDDQDIRESLKVFLDNQKNCQVIEASASVEEFLSHRTAQKQTHVVLMDIELPGMSGIEGMKILKTKWPHIEIIMLTIYHDVTKIFDSLCAGASGYLLKNTPLRDVAKAIEELLAGGAPMSPPIARKVINHFNPKSKQKTNSTLSPRQKEVVIGLVDGLSYKMIAEKMNISLETVRQHIKNIYGNLHVHSKAEVISKSLRGEI